LLTIFQSREIVIPDQSHHGRDETKNRKIEKMKNILISEQDDGYGICSDDQIEAVKTRMEIICDKMGFHYRYDNGANDFPEDMHDETELVFELAMDCAIQIPTNYAAAVEAANNQCPLPQE
jgi:hypothetical protein